MAEAVKPKKPAVKPRNISQLVQDVNRLEVCADHLEVETSENSEDPTAETSNEQNAANSNVQEENESATAENVGTILPSETKETSVSEQMPETIENKAEEFETPAASLAEPEELPESAEEGESIAGTVQQFDSPVATREENEEIPQTSEAEKLEEPEEEGNIMVYQEEESLENTVERIYPKISIEKSTVEHRKIKYPDLTELTAAQNRTVVLSEYLSEEQLRTFYINAELEKTEEFLQVFVQVRVNA